MDIENYKKIIQGFSDSELRDQYSAITDCGEMCWDNAHDCYGSEREHWFDEYNKCLAQSKAIESEANIRGIEL